MRKSREEKIQEFHDFLLENVEGYERKLEAQTERVVCFGEAIILALFREMFDKYDKLFYGEDE